MADAVSFAVSGGGEGRRQGRLRIRDGRRYGSRLDVRTQRGRPERACRGCHARGQAKRGGLSGKLDSTFGQTRLRRTGAGVLQEGLARKPMLQHGKRAGQERKGDKRGIVGLYGGRPGVR